MHTFWTILGWLFTCVFTLLLVSMLLLRNWGAALALFLLVLLCLPPVTAWLGRQFGWGLHPLLRGVLIVALLALFSRFLMGGKQTSIYKSPEIEAQLMAIYDAKMADWPVPYEDRFVETEYGPVHVIVSGPEDGPPLLLLHASGVSSWSWIYNVAGLSQTYRTYAVDLIGDVGKSRFTDFNHTVKTAEDQARLYTEITDKLGIEKAYVVGASDGGAIASNYARFAPERVEKMVLLAPMGYAGATSAVVRIMLAQFFPLKWIQDSTFGWAFSDSPALQADFGAWFRLFMTGYIPTRVAPLPMAAAARQSITTPTLFVFGTRDNLVGDPEAARALVQDMPDAHVVVVEAGHLMGGELPEEINRLITDFFAEE